MAKTCLLVKANHQQTHGRSSFFLLAEGLMENTLKHQMVGLIAQVQEDELIYSLKYVLRID